MLFNLMLLAAATQTTAASPTQPMSTEGIVLWRDLRVGISVEQAAEALRRIEGVKEVRVKVKKGIPSDLDIKYNKAGIPIAEHMFAIAPVFVSGRLTALGLGNDLCASIAFEQAKLLDVSLREKYPEHQMETVVDENNVKIDRRSAYWNDTTRVRLTLQSVAPPTLTYQDESAGGLAGSLAKLANALNKSAVEGAFNACPKDAGYKMQTTVAYSSQADFFVQHEAETEEREQQAKARKDAL